MIELFWFLITAMLVITIHEAGHLMAAIACGIPVRRFSIGFGKPLLMREVRLKTQTQPLEIALAPIPLGGYVSFEQTDGEGAATFDAMPLRSRLITVLAGPVANFILAMMIWLALGLWGQTVLVPKLAQPLSGSVADRAAMRSGDWVRSVTLADESPVAIHGLEQLLEVWMRALEQQVPLTLEVERDGQVHEVTLDLSKEGLNGQAASLQTLGFAGVWTAPVIGKVLANGPADRAGLLEGDWVQSIDGQATPDAVTLRRVIRQSGSKTSLGEQIWQIQRNGQTLRLPLMPEQVVVDGVAQTRVQIMVGSPPQQQVIQLGMLESIHHAFSRLIKGTQEMGQALTGLFDVGPAGQAGGQAQIQAQLVGPVGLAQMARQSADLGVEPWLLFVASLSLSLAWLNLLPIPVLDGGQAVLLGVEAAIGKTWVDRIRPLLHRVGVFLLLGLMAWAIYNDATRWMSGAVLPR